MADQVLVLVQAGVAVACSSGGSTWRNETGSVSVAVSVASGRNMQGRAPLSYQHLPLP